MLAVRSFEWHSDLHLHQQQRTGVARVHQNLHSWNACLPAARGLIMDNLQCLNSSAADVLYAFIAIAPRLRQLCLRGIDFLSDDWFGTFGGLEIFHLQGCSARECLSGRAFLNWPTPSRLIELRVKTSSKVLCGESDVFLRVGPTLQRLEIVDCDITTSFASLGALHSLRLTKCDRLVRSCEPLRHMHSLRRLDLGFWFHTFIGASEQLLHHHCSEFVNALSGECAQAAETWPALQEFVSGNNRFLRSFLRGEWHQDRLIAFSIGGD